MFAAPQAAARCFVATRPSAREDPAEWLSGGDGAVQEAKEAKEAGRMVLRTSPVLARDNGVRSKGVADSWLDSAPRAELYISQPAIGYHGLVL